ncbi:inositol monophosphatase family protein [Fructilactobacillus fructivorans]|nr:inositol monophosphatase family protein [Fructilactobacillus fructivorans]
MTTVDNLKRIDHDVCQILTTARAFVMERLNGHLDVNEKTGRKDLVTNIDKDNEKFFVKQLRALEPGSKVLGEEGLGDKIDSLDGQVWIVDPIDGTMNFVKQRDHFAMMIAYYVDGVPTLGFIYDVINDKLYHGGPDIGIYVNSESMNPPANNSLEDGLIGMSGPLIIRDVHHMQEIAEASSGYRIYGSAGIEIAAAISGKTIGYISHLRPWDIAAGRVLAETLGMTVSTIDGKPIDMLSSNTVLLATKKAQKDILKISTKR